MDPIKIQGIANWPTPTSVKQVRSFMGFCNFYRPFIFQFSHIARPLNQLTKKDTPWEWGPKQQQAFETLQKRITSEPVLMQPRLEEPFEIEVDASGYAVRAILIQRDKTGKRHPIAYFSATLTDTECNYDIYELEFYVIVRALRHWRQFVAGSVTFELNVRLDLSGKATTQSLRSLCTKLLFKILGESTWAVAIWVIRGDEGVGDIPGIRGGSGES